MNTSPHHAPPGTTSTVPETVEVTAHSADVIKLRLRRVIDAIRWVSRGERTGAGLWPLPVAAVAIFALDASVVLPPLVRVVLALAWCALAVRFLLGFIPSSEARRAGMERAAKLLEERLGIRNNAVINGLQLRNLATEDGLPGALAARAVSRGIQAVKESESARIVDTSSARRAWLGASVALGAVLVLTVASPRFIAMSAARFADPLGDHPPYTPTRFDIELSPAEPLAGDDVRIDVRLSGPLPANLEFVMVDDKGRELQAASMTALRAPIDNESSSSPSAALPPEPPRCDRYVTTLHALRAPIRFHVRGDTGRSETILIEPVAKPRIRSASITVFPPSYTGLPPRGMSITFKAPEPGRVQALVGSNAEIKLAASLDLADVVDTGTTASSPGLHALEGVPDGPQEWSIIGSTAVGRIALTRPGTIEIKATPRSHAGLASDDAVHVLIDVVKDFPPEIMVRQPAQPDQEAFALPGASIPVSALVRDDVGLSFAAGDWELTSPGDVETRSGRWTSLSSSPLASAALLSHRIESIIDPQALGAEPGDTLSLYISARDNRGEAFGGPQECRVGPLRVRILSPEEFARRYAEELDVSSVIRPYELITRRLGDLEGRAEQLAQNASRLQRAMEAFDEPAPETSGAAQDAARLRADAGTLEKQRGDLLRMIDERLDQPSVVPFDDQMREPLRKLRDRLNAVRSADESSSEAAENLAPRHGDGQDETDRARVGEWIEHAADAAAEAAEQAALAGDEARLDITHPSETLQLADQLQRALEEFDRVAKEQRAFADRLDAMQDDPLDARAFQELAGRQSRLLGELEVAASQLRDLGDRAAHRLPAVPEAAELARDVLAHRAAVRDALAEAGKAADAFHGSLLTSGAAAAIREAADLALLDLYSATDPAVAALRSLAAMNGGPVGMDQPGAAQPIDDLQRAIDAGLELLEELKLRLDSESRMPSSEPVARIATPPQPAFGAQMQHQSLQASLGVPCLNGIMAAVIGAATISPSPEQVFREKLEEARFRIDRLTATLRLARQRFEPLLPAMGASAIALSERIEQSGASTSMSGAAESLEARDLAEARRHARAAADALESLYERSRSGGGGGSNSDELDQPLRLTAPAPGPASRSSAESGSESMRESPASTAPQDGDGQSEPSGTAQQPSTLDQLRANRQRRQDGAGQPSNEQPSVDAPGFRQSDAAVPGRAGHVPARDGQEYADAEGSGSTSGDHAADANPSAAARARFFNEKLYATQLSDPREASISAASAELADATTVETPGTVVRAEDMERAFERAGVDGVEAWATMEFVPPGYRDLVSRYFLRIAHDLDKRRPDRRSVPQAAPSDGGPKP